MSVSTALFYKGIRYAANVRRLIREQSLLKTLFVLAFAVGFELGMFLLFVDGLLFFRNMGGAGALIISRLFSLFFFGMGSMLVVSGLVTSYASLFRSDEMEFLVSGPLTMSHIVLYKFTEAATLASWAFSFIVIPFVTAYALLEHLSPLFVLWTFLFSLPFLVLCSGLGTLAVLIAVRWFPSGRMMRLLGLVLAAIAVVVLLKVSREISEVSLAPRFDLARLVPGLSFASNRLAPSWWLSEGIFSLNAGEWTRGTMLWLTLASTAAISVVLVEWIGGAVFYDAWQKVVVGIRPRKRSGVLLAGLERCLRFLSPDLRAMILKDLRTFFRDPMQWSQALIFFGLLALYFANLRSFRYDALADRWRNTVALLNVFSVSAVMCSLASRFVYPQLSLEGQAFWIIGLSPTTMRRVLLCKFVLALIGMLTVSVILMHLSASMLRAEWPTRLMAIALAVAMSFSVSGLSTGLGAVFLDLNRRNPAAIVSGFGGTLNLVLGLVFMLCALLPMSIALHIHLNHPLASQEALRALIASASWLVLVTIAFTITPLWFGLRSLQKQEF